MCPQVTMDCDLSCREKIQNDRGQTYPALLGKKNAGKVTEPIEAIAMLSAMNTKIRNRNEVRSRSTIVCADLRYINKFGKNSEFCLYKFA